jgi:hypothetical protein
MNRRGHLAAVVRRSRGGRYEQPIARLRQTHRCQLKTIDV